MTIKRREVYKASQRAEQKEYSVTFDNLSGGLNLWELDYRLNANESPEMRNLFWQDGVLSCRDGQEWVFAEAPAAEGITLFDRLFHGFAVWHAGTRLYCADLDAVEPAVKELVGSVAATRGTFFRYHESLFYKTTGSFIQIDFKDGSLEASDVKPYAPIVLINADPSTAAGDLYQPENRLTNQKTVWYNAKSGVKEFQLPEVGIRSVDKVVVDGKDQSPEKVDTIKGTVTLTTAPAVTEPATNNTIAITYTSAGDNADDLRAAIMDCKYATVYGAEVDLCIVMAGSKAQPNAYFWNGNNVAMDPGYWPVDQYNLAGNAADAITGFGKQQNQLIIFSEGSIGKVELGTVEISERAALSMDYTAINDRIGCDLPWTIQLIENNLVFCNTDSGVHVILSTSSAYENNIQKISRNIDGTPLRRGLLHRVRKTDPDAVCSVDDGNRYWVVAGGEAYVWDYELSTFDQPSWFFFTNIGAVAFCAEQDKLWHIDSAGRFTRFRRTFMDYGEAIDKLYRFAYQHFGTYDRLKDVTTVLLMIRSDVSSNVRVRYLCDYGTRDDATNLMARSFSHVPRDLSFRDLTVSNLAAVFRRRPGLRHLHHFAVELSNNTAGEDMSIVSAQVFFKYQGRER